MSVDQESKDGMTAFVMMLLIVPVSLLNGWALIKLWAWFIVPVFRCPQLTVWTAVGIVLVVRFLTSSVNPEDKRSPIYIIVYSIVSPLFSLGFGAIIHSIGRFPQ